MTRGRKKDLTIPPTRALVQQRDYRARKAHYVSELEERCRKAEEENAQLRKDLELARASLSVPYLFNPLATELSAELQQNLSLLSNSLAKFQDFAKQHPLPEGPSRGVQLPPIQDCFRVPPPPPPLVLPAPHTSPPLAHITPPPLTVPHHQPYPTSQYPNHPLHVPNSSPSRSRKRLCRGDSPSSSRSDSRGAASTSSRYDIEPHRSSSPESDCCGGIFDCSELCREDHEHTTNGSYPRSPSTRFVQSEERGPSRYSSSQPPFANGNERDS